MDNNTNFEWPPLESDPSIFTEYAQSLGLKSDFCFNEIFSLDYKEVQPIDTPVLAVIVSYERNVAQVLTDSNFKEENAVNFYMKQTEVLDNACGVIAMLHSIGNNLDQIEFDQDAVLQKLFDSTKSLSALEKAKFLESFEDFKTKHKGYAAQGQSNLCEEQSDVKHHFVCFAYQNGNLVEFDGLIKGPYVIKEGIQKEELLDATIEELKTRLANQNITESLSLMFLTKN